MDPRGDLRSRRHGAQRLGDPMVDQHPRIDDLRELAHPVERRVDVARDLLQEGVDGRRIPLAELARELQVHS